MASNQLQAGASFDQVINSDKAYWEKLPAIDRYNVADDFFNEKAAKSPDFQAMPDDEKALFRQGFFQKYNISEPQTDKSPLQSGLENFAERASFGLYNAPDTNPRGLQEGLGAGAGQLAGGLANTVTGGLIGAGIGGAVGSIVPGAGTALGAATGSYVGQALGAGIGEYQQNLRDQLDRGVREVNYPSALLAGGTALLGQAIPGLGAYRKASALGKMAIMAGGNAALGAASDAGEQLIQRGRIYNPASVGLSAAAGAGLGLGGELLDARLSRVRSEGALPKLNNRPIGLKQLQQEYRAKHPVNLPPLTEALPDAPEGALQASVSLTPEEQRLEILRGLFGRQQKVAQLGPKMRVPEAARQYQALRNAHSKQVAEAWLNDTVAKAFPEMKAPSRKRVTTLVQAMADKEQYAILAAKREQGIAKLLDERGIEPKQKDKGQQQQRVAVDLSTQTALQQRAAGTLSRLAKTPEYRQHAEILNAYAEAMAQNKPVRALYWAENAGTRGIAKPFDKFDLPYDVRVSNTGEVHINVITNEGQPATRVLLSEKGSQILEANVADESFQFFVTPAGLGQNGQPVYNVARVADGSLVDVANTKLTKASVVHSKLQFEAAIRKDPEFASTKTTDEVMKSAKTLSNKDVNVLLEQAEKRYYKGHEDDRGIDCK